MSAKPDDRPVGRELSVFVGNGSALIVHGLPDLYCPNPADANCAGGPRLARGIIEPAN